MLRSLPCAIASLLMAGSVYAESAGNEDFPRDARPGPEHLRNKEIFIHEGNMRHPDLDLTNDHFDLSLDPQTLGVCEFRDPKDPLHTNFVTTSGADEDAIGLGDMVFRYRLGDDVVLRTARTNRSADIRSFSRKDAPDPTLAIQYEGQPKHSEGIRDFSLERTYTLEAGLLRWTATIQNTSAEPLEFGDVGFPLPWNERWERDQVANYEQRVYRHTLLAQDGGYLYMQRPGGMGRILAMLPETGSDFEIFRRSLEGTHGPAGTNWVGLVTFYVHGRQAFEDAVASPRIGGNGHDWVPGHIEDEWFVPTTRLTLDPGESKEFAFRFRWADDFDGLGDLLVDAGKVDVRVIPGMVVPTDLRARLAVRMRGGVTKLVPEFPDATRLTSSGTHRTDEGREWQLYDIHFSKYGPNNVTIEYGDGRRIPLRFFVTLPWEETIKRHAAFKVQRQLHRDPADGYDGAFLLWNQELRCASHPETVPGLPPFFYGTDDLGYGQALFLARKNEIFPDADEIAALDYHLDRWIWDDADGNELQDHETFGIWWAWPKVNGTGRSYNYPHLMNTYLSMYRIQKWYGLSKYLTAREYLDRAWRTAKALYELPSWENGNTEWGLMGESTWPDLIAALREEGMTKEARETEVFWTRKAEHICARAEQYPFGSEISIDSTAFEACHALARWRGDAEFIETIHRANAANRGHQPAWYVYAGDNRMLGDTHYQLSYMTQLGGWALLDYVLHEAREPERSRLLRLAYAAVTAPWANVRKTDDENDAAANWVFHVENGPKGWAPADGEIPIGFFGGLLAARSIVAEDPVFGLSGYGCEVSHQDGSYRVMPRDGVRQRFSCLPGELHLGLGRDHFESLAFDEDRTRIAFTLENPSGLAHETWLTITHPRGGAFALSSGETTQRVDLNAGAPSEIPIPLTKAETQTWRLELLQE